MSYNCEFEKILNEVHHYFEMGRYEQTLNKIEQIMAIKPNDCYILYLRANCLFYIDQYREAEEYCKQALINGFSACECNYLFGLILMETKKYVEAEACFLEALGENPHRADIIAVYGFLMLKLGYDKKSAKLMEEALRIEPENETVLHYKFYYHLAKNRRDDQIAILERYLQVSDSEVRKLIKLGMMELYSDNYKAARENFKQAFLLDPTNQHILSILQSTEESTSILFLPQRIIDKLGGPAIVWVGMIIAILVLKKMQLSKVAGIVAMFYIGVCLYTWVTPAIYKIIAKNK